MEKFMKIVSYKDIIKLAWPVIVSQSAVTLSGAIDLAFIGCLGAYDIAAAAITNIFCATMYAYLEGIRSCTTIFTAKAAAEKQPRCIGTILGNSMLIALCIGLLICVVGGFASEVVYDLCNNNEIASIGIPYLRTWLFSVPVFLCSFVFIGMFRGLGDTKQPLYAAILTTVANATLNWVFIFGNLGMPKLGMQGAAIDTVVSGCLGLVFLMAVWLRKGLHKKYGIHIDHVNLKTFISNCGEMGFNIGSATAACMLFVFIISKLGAVAVAAHQIAFQIFLLAYLPATGFMVASMVLVPQLLVQADIVAFKKSVERIFIMSLTISFIISLSVFIFAKQIAVFFSSASAEAADMAVYTLRIICLGQLCTAVYQTFRGAAMAYDDTRAIILQGLCCSFAFFLPTAYLLAIVCRLGLFGAYAAFIMWCLADAIFFLYRFYQTKPWFEKISTKKLAC
jgi:putative MATE family efflux protein